MIQQLWRFRTSVLPGIVVAALLLGVALLLFGTLLSTEGSSDASIDGRILGLLRFTLYQATLSTLFSLLIGLLLAWSLSHRPQFHGRSILVALFSSSLVLPSLIVAFGIITVLGNHGWVNQLTHTLTGHALGHGIYGLGGILIAHVYLNASFASIGLLRAFESIPIEKYRLAKSLGLTPWRRFVVVEWVAIRGSIPSIASTIFLLCFSSFAIVLLLGGNPAYNTLEVAIYEAVRIDFDIPFALRLALIQLGISSLLVLFSSNLRSGLANLKESSRTVTWHDPHLYRLLQGGIIAVLAILYLLPLLAVLIDGLQADLGAILSRSLFWRSLWMSLGIAGVSAGVTVLASIALADAKRHFGSSRRITGGWEVRLANALLSFAGNLYLAIPSLILGLGFFLIAQRFGGDILIWGITAIITANILMSLPFALSVMAPAMQKTAQRYDRLTFSLGLTPWQRWRHAEWPYLRRSIGYIFALSFSLSLGDLGVVALFGNREITTLPWYLYQLMGSYRTTDAAGVALILLVLVIAIFFVVHFDPRRSKHAAR
jgi:thiamine transport system permease protein